MWNIRDVLYAVLYVCVCCCVVCGCAVSWRYIDVCYCDMFSVVNMYHDHLIVQPIVAHCCKVMYFGCFEFMGELGFLNCDDICMCVVNKHVEVLELVFIPVYVDLKSNESSVTFTAG